MNRIELDRLTEEFKKDRDVRVRAGGIVTLSLFVFFLSALAVFAGCGGKGGPTEPSPTIVGTWSGPWKIIFGGDGSYYAKLYGSSFDIENNGNYRCRSGCQAGDLLRLEYIQFNHTKGTSVSGVSVLEIVTLTADTLELRAAGVTARYRRVS